jgi:hypothetical protein
MSIETNTNLFDHCIEFADWIFHNKYKPFIGSKNNRIQRVWSNKSFDLTDQEVWDEYQRFLKNCE